MVLLFLRLYCLLCCYPVQSCSKMVLHGRDSPMMQQAPWQGFRGWSLARKTANAMLRGLYQPSLLVLPASLYFHQVAAVSCSFGSLSSSGLRTFLWLHFVDKF